MTYDILIKGGIIIDGSGKPRFQGDVATRDGVIRDIGNPDLPGADAKLVIEAAGKIVAPGFIDITNHADKNWSLFSNPHQDHLLTQGITTVLVGNCGSSLAPLVSPAAVDSLRKWGSASGANINWLTVGELLTELSRHALGVNVATLMGHGTIRRGITKGESRALTPEELQQFIEAVEKGIADGAFGLSSGLVYSHEAAATEGEFASIGRALANAGAVYKTHVRSEGGNLVSAVNEAVQVGRVSGANVVLSHLKAIGRKSWPSFKKTLQMLERASEDSPRFHFDISPYLRTGSFLYLLLPLWAREGGFGAMLERIEAPETRATLIAELARATLHYDRYIVADSTIPNANGRTIAELAARAGDTPEEALLDLLTASGGRVTIFGKTLSSSNLALGIAHPLGIVASDGSGVTSELGQSGKLIHPRSTGAFPHFLHRYVREKELVSWEEGIRKITSLPAEAVGIPDRGRIEKNYRADIVIFDPANIQDRSSYENPYIHSAGVDVVLVNGEVAIDGGRITEKAAGQVLKKSR